MTNDGIWTPGEGSGRRALPLPSRGETSWRQTSLVPQEMVTCRLDLAWCAPEGVGMFAAEAYVPNTRELLALEVHPSSYWATLDGFLGHASTWQVGMLRDLFDPEPF